MTLFSIWPHSVEAKLYQRQQLVFGDVLAHIEIDTDLKRQAAYKIIQAGFTKINDYNQIFSTYIKNSEINQLNKIQKPIKHYKISDELHEAISLAIFYTQETKGHFDLTFEMSQTALHAIKLNKDKTINILESNVILNPTGLIKGLVIDKIMLELKKNNNINAAMIKLSGDIAVFNRANNYQTIKIYNPNNNGDVNSFLHEVKMVNQSISTSGQYERGQHIKDVNKTKLNHKQVSVIASKTILSDALATAMLHMPLKLIKDLKKRLKLKQVVVLTQKNKLTIF
ncbi:hypothetical protein BVY03_01780 [bacterium K02(2017)]|nr:hypothetical protein BVY03_01780 [bacterium K02(2017)]